MKAFFHNQNQGVTKFGVGLQTHLSANTALMSATDMKRHHRTRAKTVTAATRTNELVRIKKHGEQVREDSAIEVAYANRISVKKTIQD